MKDKDWKAALIDTKPFFNRNWGAPLLKLYMMSFRRYKPSKDKKQKKEE